MQVPDPELKKIFGKWQWIESSGGFAGKATTPSKEGYIARIEFSNEYMYQLYRNDTLIDRRKFIFSKDKSIHRDKQVWIISFAQDTTLEYGPPLPMEVLFQGEDTLMLKEKVYDGFSYTYVRMK